MWTVIDANGNQKVQGGQGPTGPTGPTGSAAGGDTYIVCGSTQSSTGTTLADDATLQFAVAASGVYVLEGIIWFTAGTNNGIDAKFGFTFPSGTFSVGFPPYYDPSAVAVTTLAMYSFDQTASATTGAVGVMSTATVPMSAMNIKGVLRVGASSGTFKFQFAQNTLATGTPLVRKVDSYLKYNKVA